MSRKQKFFKNAGEHDKKRFDMENSVSNLEKIIKKAGHPHAN